MKLIHSPDSHSTLISPPCFSMMDLVMNSPSPLPRSCSAFSLGNRVNFRNNYFNLSGGTPSPSFQTHSSQEPSLKEPPTFTVPPRRPYLQAFPSRFS